MIKNYAMKNSNNDENKVLFLRMVGDNYRFMGETQQAEHLASSKQDCLEHYQQAVDVSKKLHSCNRLKLGIALNMSVFYSELMNDKKHACSIAEIALKDAMDKIDDVDEETFRDAKTFIELLKENLTLWKEE